MPVLRQRDLHVEGIPGRIWLGMDLAVMQQ